MCGENRVFQPFLDKSRLLANFEKKNHVSGILFYTKFRKKISGLHI